MLRFRLTLTLLACAAPLASATAQDTAATQPVPVHRNPSARALPLKYKGPPTVADITPGDLQTRLYKFADDSMMGRQAGTRWNDKGTDYIAAEVKRLGLQPAGDSGTYFQHPLIARDVDSTSSLTVSGKAFALWKDYVPRDQGAHMRNVANATAIYAGVFGDSANYLPSVNAEAKVVVLRVGNGENGQPNANVINRGQLTARYRNAAAIAVIAIDWMPPGYIDVTFKQPRIEERRDAEPEGPSVPPYFYASRNVAQEIFGTHPDSLRVGMTGRPVASSVRITTRSAPGRNVIAILPGSDPKLRGQYVVIGAHNDHEGFNDQPVEHDSVKAYNMVARAQGADTPEEREPNAEQWVRINAVKDSLRRTYPARVDSILNGADDDGSGSVSVLEIAEAFARGRLETKRSVMFVWHVGEELGLYGSEYFTDHPTVPRDSILTELNIDMIGRGGAHDVTGRSKEGAPLFGGPGYVQLVGARRLSTELGDLVEDVNKTKKLGLEFDYAMDANGHPQNIYCRSDHYEYARYGIPIVFFTTGGHADYHQVTDEPQYIEYDHMAQIARLVQSAAVRVANLDHRVVVDHAKPDPHGRCKQ